MSRDRSRPRPDFEEIDASVLTMPVFGRGLLGPRFEDQLKPEGTLIAFLRHLGCSFCREMISEIRTASRKRPDFPDLLFIHNSSVDDGEATFAKAWPEARAIADPAKSFFGAFQVSRGTLAQLFGPSVLARGATALVKGYLPRLPAGDPLTMPGLFYVKGKRIAWEAEFRHIGDHPNFLEIPDLIHAAEKAAKHHISR